MLSFTNLNFSVILNFFLFSFRSHSSNPNKQSMANIITNKIIEAWI